jgi:hypothetical protein
MPWLTKLLSLESSDLVKRCLLISFAFLTILVLGIDSRQMVTQGFEGQPWSNLVIVLYFGLLLWALRPDQRLMALIFVPFSAVGEYVFSLIFGLYSYRLGSVPLYVPFGHAILFSTGLLVCELSVIRKHDVPLRPVLTGLYLMLFSAVVLLLQDTLSAVFGLVFLWVIRRKGYQTLYFVMGLLVLYIELVGTFWGCWTWTPHPFNMSWLHTTNPPFGAFVCYLLADLGVMKIARVLSPHLGIVMTRDQTGATSTAS